MKCRFCKTGLEHTFVDLGFAPPSNAYLSAADLNRPETCFPLRVKVCDSCWLVQTEDYARETVFFNDDYAYYSSTSRSWLDHARQYCAEITDRLSLNKDSLVVEVAANDGYLLKNFVQAGVPCLGVEPTAGTADAAEKLGIEVIRAFFTEELAAQMAARGQLADLIVGNNVYAHVPDIRDFTAGLQRALKPGGTITLEFPHLMRLVEQAQFDTIYHEHFSYLSLFTVARIFESAGLRIYDVEELKTHGGSLRVFGCHADDARKESANVPRLLEEENAFGLQELNTYLDFQARAEQVKDDLVRFLIDAKQQGKQVLAYGAAAKGNTLLNFAGIKPDLIPFVYDAAEAKQNQFLPGSHIPILAPDALASSAPDYLLVLPWNIVEEVSGQLSHLAKRGTRFVTAVPALKIV